MAYQHCQQQAFQPCDTFFVETYDQQYRAATTNTKEQLKAMNRQRQYEIANTISQATQDEYEEDIWMHMHTMDVSFAIRDLDALHLTRFSSRKRYRTSTLLISRPKSNGSCARTS